MVDLNTTKRWFIEDREKRDKKVIRASNAFSRNTVQLKQWNKSDLLNKSAMWRAN